MPARRTDPPGLGQFALRLGVGPGQDITLLAQPSGGAVFADVIAEADASAPVLKKHLGTAKYEDLVLPIGSVMSSALLGWLASSWGSEPQPQDGSVLALDQHLTIRSETAFTGGLIAETAFPALDAANKDLGRVVITIVPATVQTAGGAGALSFASIKQKLWHSAHFRLELADLDCNAVSRIDPFTVRRRVESVVSGSGGTEVVPGLIEFPNLTVTLAQAHATTWSDWHHDFVVLGNNDDSFEREGALVFLSPDLKSELSRIELHHVGIVRLAPTPGQPTRVSAELYCEEMTLTGGVP